MSQEQEQEQKAPETARDLSQSNPLILERIRKNTDGGVDVVLSLNKTQTYILLEFALMALTAQGLVSIREEIADAPEGDAEEPVAEVVTH